MPADRLTHPWTQNGHSPGTSVPDVPTPPADPDVTESPCSVWHQIHIQFTDWTNSENLAVTRLAPHLQRAHDTDLMGRWWFIRKAPCWRLRGQPGSAGSAASRRVVADVLDQLTDEGVVDQWRETIYEPETYAFGGPQGMEIAHTLFHADSDAVVSYLRPHGPTGILGRREVSLLLCSNLFGSAGQDWYEQGDVWHRVTQMRPLPPDTPLNRLEGLVDVLRPLMTLDPDTHRRLEGTDGPLAFAAPWLAAFAHAGQRLARTAHHGTLQRGLRDVLAHHVIFHWNRLGLAATTQAVLARAARDAIMGSPPVATTSEPTAPRCRDHGITEAT